MDALELGEGGRQDDIEVLRADWVRNREVDDLRMRAEAAAFEEPIRDDDCPDNRVIDEHEQIEAGTEKADPGNHPAEERQRIVAFQVDREDRQRRRARRHEDERPEPDGLAADLSLQADPEGEGEDEQESEDALSRGDRESRTRS